MTSIWTLRLHAITEQATANASNSFWTLIAPDGDPEANSYGVPLSPTGQEPATHRGISSAFTAEMLAKLKVMQSEMADLRYYLCDAWTFALQEQRGGGLVVGQVCTWDDALDDQGLVTIQPEELL